MKASPKLSNPSKMPCPSWSLPAIVSCPGAIGDDGSLVPACSGCYAAQGRYLFGAVCAVREHNLEDWKREGWVEAMVAAIGSEPFFRWFDSGDIYCVDLALRILAVCAMTPNTRHWIPTRARKNPAIAVVLAQLEALPNVVVRHSSDGVNGERLAGFANTSTIVQKAEDATLGNGQGLCTAYRREGKCGDCRMCWSKKVAVVQYAAHGGKVSPKTIARLMPQRDAALA